MHEENRAVEQETLAYYRASVQARMQRIEEALRRAAESLERLEQAAQHLTMDRKQPLVWRSDAP